MKLNKSHYITLTLLVILLLVSIEASAQWDSIVSEDTDVNDEPTPINGLIAVALAVGGYLGIRQSRKK